MFVQAQKLNKVISVFTRILLNINYERVRNTWSAWGKTYIQLYE